MVKELNQGSFDKAVESDKLVVVDFFADWCGPCQMMKPVLEEASNDATDIEFGKVNVDEEKELASKYGVMSIPTFVVFKGGKEVGRLAGYMPKDAFLSEVKKFK